MINFKILKILIKNKITLISSDKNGGFGYANNVAFEFSKRYLKSSYCWILNNDTIVDKNAISNLVNMIKLNKNVMIGATIIEYYHKKIIQRMVTCSSLTYVYDINVDLYGHARLNLFILV